AFSVGSNGRINGDPISDHGRVSTTGIGKSNIFTKKKSPLTTDQLGILLSFSAKTIYLPSSTSVPLFEVLTRSQQNAVRSGHRTIVANEIVLFNQKKTRGNHVTIGKKEISNRNKTGGGNHWEKGNKALDLLYGENMTCLLAISLHIQESSVCLPEALHHTKSV
ncbi:hypothetical protein ACJX0J_028364, partial [Zea mays]